MNSGSRSWKIALASCSSLLLALCFAFSVGGENSLDGSLHRKRVQYLLYGDDLLLMLRGIVSSRGAQVNESEIQQSLGRLQALESKLSVPNGKTNCLSAKGRLCFQKLDECAKRNKGRDPFPAVMRDWQATKVYYLEFEQALSSVREESLSESEASGDKAGYLYLKASSVWQSLVETSSALSKVSLASKSNREAQVLEFERSMGNLDERIKDYQTKVRKLGLEDETTKRMASAFQVRAEGLRQVFRELNTERKDGGTRVLRLGSSELSSMLDSMRGRAMLDLQK